jgi:hypothetical protein
MPKRTYEPFAEVTIGGYGGRPTAYPLRSALSAMFNRAIFEKSDFPAIAFVVCSEKKVAQRFDRLTHRSAVEKVRNECGFEVRKRY